MDSSADWASALGRRRGRRKPEVSECPRGHLMPAMKEEGQVAAPVRAKGTFHPRGSRWSPLLSPEDAKEGRRLFCGEQGSGSSPTWTQGWDVRLGSLVSALKKCGVEEAHNRKEV